MSVGRGMPPASLAAIVPVWDPRRGGQEGYLAGLLPWLEARGVVPLVVASRTTAQQSPAAVLVRRRGLTGARRTRAFAKDAVATARRTGATRVLATFALPGATHVQLHGGLLADAFCAERSAMPDGLRKRFHGAASRLNGKRRALLALERRALLPPRPRLMVWSTALRESLRARHGVPPEAVTVLPPFVDTELFRPPASRAPEAGPLRIAFVAHVPALKGLATLLHALARLRRRGVAATLDVAGRGRPGPFAALAARLGLSASVRFLGPQPPGEVAALLRRSGVLAHPTHHDPCALVCLEALAAGCPVVTTRVNGASEQMTDGEDGIVLPSPGDAAALADALAALADPGVRRRMSEAAAAKGARFGIDRHGERVLSWLELA